MTFARRAAFAGAALMTAAAAPAQMLPPPQNVVSISATATVEVQKDLLTVVFSTTREGSDANAVQNQLKQAVDTALAEARKAAKPGQIDVQTGNFSLYPRYAPKGGISGWQGSAEVVVEGRDIAGIAQLTGRVQTLSIQRVVFGLSREAREKVDTDVTAQAIAKFRAKADAVTKNFGFGAYSIREVSVQSNEPPAGVPMFRMQADAVRAGADAALPVEAGRATVTANVSGSVQMSAK